MCVPACSATFTASSRTPSPRSLSGSRIASSGRFHRTSMTWIATISAFAGFPRMTATRMTSGSTLVPASGTRMRFTCIARGSLLRWMLRLARCDAVAGVFRVIRNVDDDRVRTKEQRELEAQRRLAVKHPLPPVARHELRQYHGDRTIVTLVDRLDVAEQRL